MTPQIATVYTILLISLGLFITERIRFDLVALLVLGSLAVTGLVSATDAFSGFSNPAVITVWAMFIVSQGLTRTGIARRVGRLVMRFAGRTEAPLIAVLSISAGLMSAFMNNIGVAALLLPVAVDISRITGVPPSRLLMPLAFGSLLGGLTTLVGTPPNLLVSMALQDHGHETFGLFDYTPLGLIILVAGVAFLLLIGRHLLPLRSPAEEMEHRDTADLQSRYGLKERIFKLRIPHGSVLEGKSIAESRLGSIAGLKVIATARFNKTKILPDPGQRLRGGQQLLVQGRVDRLERLRHWNELIISRERSVMWDLISDEILVFEVRLAPSASIVGQPFQHADFRENYRGNVLAIRRDEAIERTQLSEVTLEGGDRLLVQGSKETLKLLEKSPDFDECFQVQEEDLFNVYKLAERIFVLRVPSDSIFVGKSLEESGIADLFDFRLLALMRQGQLRLLPSADEIIEPEDRLLILGQLKHVDVLRGLQELEIDRESKPNLGLLDSEKVAMMEVILSPRSDLADQTVSEIQMYEKYGLEILAVWRQGKAYRSDLGSMKLRLGDAFLVLGPRDKLAMLERDPDFLVLTPVSRRVMENHKKAPVALVILAGFVIVVLTGTLPIAVAAVIAAALMVLSGCLTMEEGYRSIEWQAIFLIAGMLPLGIALQDTGAAQLAANGVVGLLADFGPWAVIFAFYGLTALATLFIPTAALVVLMAPVVMSASYGLGVEPQTAMMAIAIAASASFGSPIAHPANLLVMGPGGYSFADYLRVGLPLSLVVMIVTMIFLPLIWPLHPLG